MTDTRAYILLLDDDRLVANSLARMLRRNHFDVSICSDPQAALKFCDKMQFDLIITDQRMPVMDGTDFVLIAKDKQPQARVILISGYSDREKIDTAIANNVVHAKVCKPWDNNQLLELVTEEERIGTMNRQ